MNFWRYVSSTILSVCLAAMLSACNLPKADTTLFKADALVLLAGDYDERVPAAAVLFRGGYAPRILLTNDGVISGWSTPFNRNLSQTEWAAEALVKAGVPRERLLILPYYKSGTIFDAVAVQKYAQEHDLTRFILVTSDYHAGRTLWTFKTVFSDSPAEFRVYPAKSVVIDFSGKIFEYGKNIYYRLRYGLLGLIPEV